MARLDFFFFIHSPRALWHMGSVGNALINAHSHWRSEVTCFHKVGLGLNASKKTETRNWATQTQPDKIMKPRIETLDIASGHKWLVLSWQYQTLASERLIWISRLLTDVLKTFYYTPTNGFGVTKIFPSIPGWSFLCNGDIGARFACQQKLDKSSSIFTTVSVCDKVLSSWGFDSKQVDATEYHFSRWLREQTRLAPHMVASRRWQRARAISFVVLRFDSIKVANDVNKATHQGRWRYGIRCHHDMAWNRKNITNWNGGEHECRNKLCQCHFSHQVCWFVGETESKCLNDIRCALLSIHFWFHVIEQVVVQVRLSGLFAWTAWVAKVFLSILHCRVYSVAKYWRKDSPCMQNFTDFIACAHGTRHGKSWGRAGIWKNKSKPDGPNSNES